jgi:hypothetical protein
MHQRSNICGKREGIVLNFSDWGNASWSMHHEGDAKRGTIFELVEGMHTRVCITECCQERDGRGAGQRECML